MIILLAIFLILVEALYEGLATMGKHILSASIEFVYLAVITLACFAFVSGKQLFTSIDEPFWKIIVGYVLMRFAIFDTIWNISAGQKWNYVGITKLYDRIMQWFMNKGKVAIGLIYFVRFICLCISLAWLLNYKQ